MTNSVQANENNSDTLSMHSPNLVDVNVQKIMALFPNCITESEDENGKLKKAVDFDLLRQELSQSLVEGGQERYRLDWPGKRQAILEANSPIAKTLRPARDESVNFDTTENLFIEGDNLEALKLLQESYLGQVKMIYIDPPYNTGNDFVYEDDFSEDTTDFLARSKQLDEEGNRLITNTESNGRFHSDWLTMMYSRLKISKNLLKDDGVCFISINDYEVDNLIKICKEVYGADNVECLIWNKEAEGSSGTLKKTLRFRVIHDYILVCYKNKTQVFFDRVSEPLEGRENEFQTANLAVNESNIKEGHPNWMELTSPNGKKWYKHWKFNNDDIEKLLEDDLIYWGSDGDRQPRLIIPTDHRRKVFSQSIINKGGTTLGRKEFESIMPENVFSFPKSVKLLEHLINITNPKDIVMDFFAGSSTTAHAVMKVNAEQQSNYKFIMVQLDEVIDPNKQKEAYQFCIDNNFKTNISEVSKERIRRAGKKIVEDNQDKDGIENLDIGFRVLKIDSTNMKDVYYTPDSYDQATLANLESHIKEDRSGEDLLFQVMLDWGLPLSLPIEVKSIQGVSVYYVGINSLVACFDTLSTELIDEIARDQPLKFVSSELAIAQDQDKTNIKARFAQLSPDTQVKFI
ncbi:site-specific DNA-methyltransferase [Psychrobacter aquimaris]|uniref:site-specific DNA-methyltransferase n=1 Tax=Psychrobacter aquimaris TaxID=292733 RepID=UPI001D1189B0|nr:site-specific DNA-methyltransferase [Psychrobacter aquimaris]